MRDNGEKYEWYGTTKKLGELTLFLDIELLWFEVRSKVTNIKIENNLTKSTNHGFMPYKYNLKYFFIIHINILKL
jgi:hypothetical protein